MHVVDWLFFDGVGKVTLDIKEEGCCYFTSLPSALYFVSTTKSMASVVFWPGQLPNWAVGSKLCFSVK
jgi:hypothetical protein